VVLKIVVDDFLAVEDFLEKKVENFGVSNPHPQIFWGKSPIKKHSKTLTKILKKLVNQKKITLKSDTL
jgi:hypothetical protein